MLWGSSALYKTPTSSYNTHYKDPNSFINQKISELNAVKEDRLDELILEEFEVKHSQDQASDELMEITQEVA